MENFDNRLKIARGNVSRQEIADKTGVHVNTYGLYERGSRVPDALFLRKFCAILDINHVWLFTGHGPMYMPDNSAGLETKLFEKIFIELETHLKSSKISLDSKMKAGVVSALYEEALENQDQQELFRLDRKTVRFIKLLAEEK